PLTVRTNAAPLWVQRTAIEPRGVGTTPCAHARSPTWGATLHCRYPAVLGETPSTYCERSAVGPVDQAWAELSLNTPRPGNPLFSILSQKTPPGSRFSMYPHSLRMFASASLVSPSLKSAITWKPLI